MNPEIERIAREAAGALLGVHPDKVEHSSEWLRQVEAVTLIVASECVKAVEDEPTFLYDDPAATYAAAIRARFGLPKDSA